MSRALLGGVAGLTVLYITGYTSATFISTYWAAPNIVVPAWVTGVWITAAIPAALFLQAWWQDDVAGVPVILGWLTTGLAQWLSWCAVLGSVPNALYSGGVNSISSPGFNAYNLSLLGPAPALNVPQAVWGSVIGLMCLQLLVLVVSVAWCCNNRFDRVKERVTFFPGRTCWPCGPLREDYTQMNCFPTCCLGDTDAEMVNARTCGLACCGGYDEELVEAEKEERRILQDNPTLDEADAEAIAVREVAAWERTFDQDVLEDIRVYQYRSWPQAVISCAALAGLCCVISLVAAIIMAQALSLPPAPGYALDAAAVAVVGTILSLFPARHVDEHENAQTVWGFGASEWNYLFPFTALLLLWGSAMLIIWVVPDLWSAQGGQGRFGTAGARFPFPVIVSSHGYWLNMSSTADVTLYSQSVVLTDLSTLLLGITAAVQFFGHVLYAFAAHRRTFLVKGNARVAPTAGAKTRQRGGIRWGGVKGN